VYSLAWQACIDPVIAEPELGIWIAEMMHGHGYGREAVAAVWSAASGRLRCAAFRYPVAEQNRSSRSLAESLGDCL
jgi:RimJ/RimL family protein N-acetyltransferase